MNTSDFNTPLTARSLNENLYKNFNVRINFDKYSREELENYRNILRTKVHQVEQAANFNELLTNEGYQKNKHVLEVLNAKIKEMLGEAKLAEPAFSKSQQQAAGIALAAKKSGKKPKAGTPSATMAKMPTKELEKFAKTKHKGLPKHKTEAVDQDNDGDNDFDDVQIARMTAGGVPKKKAIAKANADSDVKEGKTKMKKKPNDGNLANNAKPYDKVTRGDVVAGRLGKDAMGGKAKKESGKKKVAEGKMTAAQRAHHHASEYMKHHKAGALEMAMHHREACEECGGMIQHGPMGECWHMHSGMNKGTPYKLGLAEIMTAEGRISFKNKISMISESIATFIAEDEEGKAKSITAGVDMVNDFTTWMQRIGNYQTKTMIELSDNIRANFGAQEAETFKASVGPTLDSALAALTQTREEINNAVSVLAGEAPAQEPMGQEPEMGAGEPPVEPGEDDSLNLPTVDDEFSASDAAAGGPDTAGRMKRESIERGNRLMRILGA